jgi:hypothetical protein
MSRDSRAHWRRGTRGATARRRTPAPRTLDKPNADRSASSPVWPRESTTDEILLSVLSGLGEAGVA